MDQEMIYLLKSGITPTLNVEGCNYPSTYGLFDLTDLRNPKPIVKPNKAEPNKYYSTTSDLAIATADYFKAKFGSINSIEATEMLEAVNIPMRLPFVDFLEDTCVVYSRFSSKEYLNFILELKKNLDGNK
nr:hypothetical protein [Candidatus Woesearchaeota archaeon]